MALEVGTKMWVAVAVEVTVVSARPEAKLGPCRRSWERGIDEPEEEDGLPDLRLVLELWGYVGILMWGSCGWVGLVED